MVRLLARLQWHELVDTPRKLKGRLRAAGFSNVNSRVEMFVERPSRAEFVARRTTLGSCQHRWASLPEEGRRVLLGRAGQWLLELSSEDFEEESEVVVTVARRGTGNRRPSRRGPPYADPTHGDVHAITCCSRRSWSRTCPPGWEAPVSPAEVVGTIMVLQAWRACAIPVDLARSTGVITIASPSP